MEDAFKQSDCITQQQHLQKLAFWLAMLQERRRSECLNTAQVLCRAVRLDE